MKFTVESLKINRKNNFIKNPLMFVLTIYEYRGFLIKNKIRADVISKLPL